MIIKKKLFSSDKKDEEDDDLIYIPKSAISNHRGAGRSLVIGGLGGALGGLIAKEGILDSISEGDRDYRKIKDDATLKGAAAGGILGAALGSIPTKKAVEKLYKSKDKKLLPIYILSSGVTGALGGGLGARKNASESIELAGLYESDIKRFKEKKSKK